MVLRNVVMVSSIFVGMVAMSLVPHPASAETHVIQMLNKNPDDPKQRQVFYPTVLSIQPGDTVRFVPSDKSHNTASVKGAIPQGAEPWRSKLNEEFEITLTEEGTYQYICTPHYGMGMVGVILVGDHSKNLDAAKAKKHPGKAKKVFTELMEGL